MGFLLCIRLRLNVEEEEEKDLLPLTQCAELFWCVIISLSGSAWLICFRLLTSVYGNVQMW